jgi:Protein of unknown function (DUF2764)
MMGWLPKMMAWSNSYHMLISSLPALPPQFDAGPLPITLERLQDRMRMLEPEDAREISRMSEILGWTRQYAEQSDAAVVKRYGELMQEVSHPLVRETLAIGMDVRLIVAALRRRRAGLGPPNVGPGQWLEEIRRHFRRPDLGLGHVYPWIPQFDQMLGQRDSLNLYRNILRATWTYFKKRSDDYYFSFEAVVLYIARWDIIRHWQQLQPERGREVFEALVTEVLGEHAKLHS